MNEITYADKVALNENASINDINKITANDMNQIKSVVNSLANLFFPIKKIIIFNDNEDHSNYLGFTWEKIAGGKVLIGIDSTDTDFNTIGKIGGEKEHTLTIDEMPSHSHSVKANDNAAEGTAIGVIVPYSYTGTNRDTSKTGGDQPHNNLQPYQVVAYWQRIS